MSGWLYDRITAELAPYGMTIEQYIAELQEQGAMWTEIRECMKADNLIPWGKQLSATTIKNWATRT